MFRSLASRSVRYRVGLVLVGAAALLLSGAGGLPRAPNSIDIPIPITDPVAPPDRQL
jgi:hypothetical protein